MVKVAFGLGQKAAKAQKSGDLQEGIGTGDGWAFE
jgi:hypothetical protein